uniref:Uncharacterized protein n=1 Tax=viral metagenome TaxID=1070528 RepID=A0A6C0CLK1_9ZZZZ
MDFELGCVFSHWIFLWTIVYYFNILPLPSPYYFLILAIIYNVFHGFYLLYKTKNISHNLIYWGIITVTKIIPAYVIRNNKKSINDIYFGCLLFIAYLLYYYNYCNVDKILNGNYFKNPSYGKLMKEIFTFFKL